MLEVEKEIAVSTGDVEAEAKKILAKQTEAAVSTLVRMGFLYSPPAEAWVSRQPEKDQAFKAPELLEQAYLHMQERAKTYDQEGGERSIAATVEAFNAVTGRDMKESEGWLLMALLKMVRSQAAPTPHRDSVEDLVSYAALYGEAKLADK